MFLSVSNSNMADIVVIFAIAFRIGVKITHIILIWDKTFAFFLFLNKCDLTK